MTLKIAAQMDPIGTIDIRGDSTFAILLEAERRGYDVFYYTPQNLSLHGDKILARGSTLKVQEKAGDHYSLSDPRTIDLSERDVVPSSEHP